MASKNWNDSVDLAYEQLEALENFFYVVLARNAPDCLRKEIVTQDIRKAIAGIYEQMRKLPIAMVNDDKWFDDDDIGDLA